MKLDQKHIYKIESINLIQEIRLIHALSKFYNLSVSTSVNDKLQYLINNFNINFSTITNTDISLFSIIKLDHKTPYININDINYNLIFSNDFINFFYNKWDTKSINIIFIGLITAKRKVILQNLNVNILIINSTAGRHFPNKAFDMLYYNNLLQAKFTLCLDGDFIWTYRFFEAIMCGSIPIIQNMCDLYIGFKYYTINDIGNLHYSKEMIIHNYQLLLLKFTLKEI